MKNILLFLFFWSVVFVQAQTPMITEWEFTNATNTQLYTRGSANYSMKNASNQIVSSGSLVEGENIISVPQTGVYTMEISNSSNFAFNGWDEINHQGIFPREMKRFLQWGDVDLNNDLSWMFGFSKIQMISTDIPVFKPNTILNNMFFGSSSFTGDLSGWDVSNVTEMQWMFRGTISFTSDLSGWDVSNVTDMHGMFSAAESFNGDISGWDVSNVTDMGFMFYEAEFFNGDISGWDVSNVTDMSGMFSEARFFNGDLSGWDTSGVSNMNGMFYKARSFNGDISGWDVSNVTDMMDMFNGAISFNGDISGWNVSGVTDMRFMFNYAASFNSDLSDWDVSNVTYMSFMFSAANSFNGDLSSWNVANVTYMSFMFDSATSFSSDLSGWNVTNLINAEYMFNLASSFTSDLSGWNISNATHMNHMFNNSGMTCNDYSRTLISWSNQDVNSNVNLGATNIPYGPAAVNARDYLINTKGWTIAGDIYDENCEMALNDLNLFADIKVINPVKERIQLITEERINRVTVYDVSGKKVKEFKGTSTSVADIPAGIYFLRIQTANGIKNIKVVKE